ncbi:hypothetical protein K2173_016305 [Erythroxylum novogranatense]|uniref:Uncharacterized protein n=1 Tax=Erythroxylum novogranatense TaxID=1862640 RepID=A0AAV8SGH7_9ROSI|nr:hypothetical protein K2173_016305 [Erythroxylum novogranatense]
MESAPIPEDTSASSQPLSHDDHSDALISTLKRKSQRGKVIFNFSVETFGMTSVSSVPLCLNLGLYVGTLTPFSLLLKLKVMLI